MSTNIDSILAQTQVGSTDKQRVLLQKVYAWMFGGLLVTTAIAYATVSVPEVLFAVANYRFIFMIAQLGLVMWLSAGINRMSALTAQVSFIVYAALNGLTFSILLLFYTGESLASTFLSCAALYGTASIYGMVTKRDLRSVGSFFFIGLIGLVISMFINYFLQSTALAFAISAIGVVVFTALTAYDTQKIADMAAELEADGATSAKLSILGALTLYLDFLNLFLFLLRLLGRQRN